MRKIEMRANQGQMVPGEGGQLRNLDPFLARGRLGLSVSTSYTPKPRGGSSSSCKWEEEEDE